MPKTVLKDECNQFRPQLCAHTCYREDRNMHEKEVDTPVEDTGNDEK